MSPKRSTIILPCKNPDHNFSNFSKTTKENTGQFGVPTVFESSVSQVSHGGFALQRERESKESVPRETVARERERRKRRFSDQCCKVDVNEKSAEQY